MDLIQLFFTTSVKKRLEVEMEPEKRKALIALLSSPEEEERRLAMETLKADLSESDLDWLKRPLSDESWRVRKESIEGLSQIPPTPGFVASLVPLMDPEMELTLRNSVVEILERLGHEAATLLVEHLNTGQADVRKFLVDILGNIAHPETVPSLLGLLNDPEDNIKAAAAEALAAIGDPSVCEGLLSAMGGADDWVIYSILGSLAKLKCRKALPVFFKYMENQLHSKPSLDGIGAMGSIEDGIRLIKRVPSLKKGAVKSAFLAIGSIYRQHVSKEDIDTARDLREAVAGASDPNMLQSLVSQLEVSDNLDDCRDIIAALGMIGTKEALQPILTLVEDDATAWDVDLALLTVGKKDVGLIAELLNHHDPLVRQKSIRTLKILGNVDSLHEIYSLLEDGSGHVRKDAAMAVSRLGDSSSIERLLPLLEDEYQDVAQSAAHSLVHLGQRSPEGLAARIIPMLQSASPPLFSLLIMILTEVQAPDWEDLCLKAAQNTEPTVRAAAVSCLKRSESSAAAATIINSLADENSQVRAQAVVTLEELKHPEAIIPLKAAVHDQDPWVRSAAVSALSAQPAAAPSDFQELLKGEDLMMQTAALDALGRMAASGNEDAMGMLAEQFETGSLEMRRSICRLLGKISGPRAFDLLRKAVEDDDPGIRVFAVHSLSQREEIQVPEILLKAGEKDPDKQVREAARSVLEGLD
jgi:HEAT repeat protein